MTTPATQRTAPEQLAKLRCDTVGSLLRPPELIGAFDAFARGEIDEAARIRIEDDCIAAVVDEQQRHGLPIVSDGEYRRIGYMQSFSDVAGMLSWRDDWAARLSAMSRPEDDDSGEHRDADPSQIERARVTERHRLVRNRPLEEFNTVAQRVELADRR